MGRSHMLSSSIIALASSLGVLAAIGPTADLELVNMVVSPDGFERSAISAGGEGVIGSLITANKGDTLSINVIDKLSDDSMLVDTSVVRSIILHLSFSATYTP